MFVSAGVLQAGYCCASLPILLKYIQNTVNIYKVAALTAVAGGGTEVGMGAETTVVTVCSGSVDKCGTLSKTWHLH